MEGLAEGSGPPRSPGAGGAKARGLLEGPAGLGAAQEGGTRADGGGCGRLSVPRLGRPRSAEGPARPRGAHPATPALLSHRSGFAAPAPTLGAAAVGLSSPGGAAGPVLGQSRGEGDERCGGRSGAMRARHGAMRGKERGDA